MNYYNPYFAMSPYVTAPARAGLFSRLLGGNGITLSSILSGTQKAIGFANQAIPLVKQVTPVMKNARTMFRVMNEFKKVETPSNSTSNSTTRSQSNNINTMDTTVTSSYSEDGPTFFI